MRILLGRQRRQLDDRVRFGGDLLQQGRGIVAGHGKALEQLARRQQHLIGGFAPARSPAHAIGHDAQHTAIVARVRKQGHLVLLVVAIALVQASGGGQTVAFGHVLVSFGGRLKLPISSSAHSRGCGPAHRCWQQQGALFQTTGSRAGRRRHAATQPDRCDEGWGLVSGSLPGD